LEGGLVDSLARPGRNVTGVSFYADKALFGKYLQLLREAKPSIRRVGVLWSQVPPLFLREEIEQAFAQFRNDAIRLKLGVHIMEVGTPEDVDAAVRTVESEGIDALVLTVGRPLLLRSKQVMDFTAQKKLPALTDLKWDWVEPRPLLCYGATLQAMARQATGYVDRILWGGAMPGDLPMQQPTKFELVVNLRTAKMIGITIPPSLLLRADEVIQ
jgi:putative tryptophan/tyrosine transport system substrate-binding protein